jgi:hypothetical protein
LQHLKKTEKESKENALIAAGGIGQKVKREKERCALGAL